MLSPTADVPLNFSSPAPARCSVHLDNWPIERKEIGAANKMKGWLPKLDQTIEWQLHIWVASRVGPQSCTSSVMNIWNMLSPTADVPLNFSSPAPARCSVHLDNWPIERKEIGAANKMKGWLPKLDQTIEWQLHIHLKARTRAAGKC